MKLKLFLAFIFIILLSYLIYLTKNNQLPSLLLPNQINELPLNKITSEERIPLSISAMRSTEYPGSEIKIEEQLPSGSNYQQYITSYISDGLKIYALLTVPYKTDPNQKFPAIIFNHGYIPPDQYQTTQRYVSYVDSFARNGYIVFKPDYRGHGDSEGQPEGGYYSPAYTRDVLNALASIKKYKATNKDEVGMWGHSMGGNLTLRSLVVRPDEIKAAVIWGGVVGTYDDLMNHWRRQTPFQLTPQENAVRGRVRAELITKYGSPTSNPNFWNSLDPNAFLSDIKTPIQLHSGESDEEVPFEFSQGLKDRLDKLNKPVEFYLYPNDNHNISNSFNLAMQRSVAFFDKYLKGGDR